MKKYKVEIIKEGMLGTIFFGSSKLPLKKMEKIRKTNFSMSFEFYNVLDRKNKKLFFLFLFDVI